MSKRRLAFALTSASTLLGLGLPDAGCATAVGGSSFSNSNGGGNSLAGDNTSSGASVAQGNGLGSNVITTNEQNADGGRLPRCDDAGHCTCFNIASLGYGGATGANFGNGTALSGTDNTQAFVDYLNTQSSASVAQLGCGQDTGCTSPMKPTLDQAFLSQYDVLIFQWMTNSLTAVTSMSTGLPVGFEGNGYWNFTADELTALTTWVQGGGGVIVLSGYDYEAGEIGPANQILQALTSGAIQYTSADTFGNTETGNAELCLGDTDPVTGWAPAPDMLGENITEIGAFHGRHIVANTPAIIDCNDAGFVATGGATTEGGICAAHFDLGKGHVYAYTDEWVTYTSQWNPTAQPAGYCLGDASALGTNGDYPSVQEAYQVPQFWYNAISYAAQATMCTFTLTGAVK
ncbi:MAG: hypothetical protein ABSC94_19115 [Polyangiaceae bacterium]|jgi:hypothetical protein